ncbi:hypothetical protein LUZ60_003205 [Juncus effusus]|nr:hypothetical protein LUZ60_003205 [Juncus effusus]
MAETAVPPPPSASSLPSSLHSSSSSAPLPPNPLPSTGYAVELYFDPALENQVLKSWNVLARRQITSHLIEIESRPHLTLLSFSSSASSLDPLRLLSPLRSLAARLDPVPLTLSGICSSPKTEGSDAGTLFYAPVPTAALLGLHAQLIELIKKEGVEAPDGFRLDEWVPGCEVAKDVVKSRVGEAFAVLREMKLPVSGYGMDIGLVEFNPVREIFSFPLGGGSDA